MLSSIITSHIDAAFVKSYEELMSAYRLTLPSVSCVPSPKRVAPNMNNLRTCWCLLQSELVGHKVMTSDCAVRRTHRPPCHDVCRLRFLKSGLHKMSRRCTRRSLCILRSGAQATHAAGPSLCLPQAADKARHLTAALRVHSSLFCIPCPVGVLEPWKALALSPNFAPAEIHVFLVQCARSPERYRGRKRSRRAVVLGRCEA